MIPNRRHMIKRGQIHHQMVCPFYSDKKPCRGLSTACSCKGRDPCGSFFLYNMVSMPTFCGFRPQDS